MFGSGSGGDGCSREQRSTGNVKGVTGHGGAHIVAIITVEGQLDTDHDDEYYHRKRHCCYDDYTIVVVAVVGSMHHRHVSSFFLVEMRLANIPCHYFGLRHRRRGQFV